MTEVLPAGTDRPDYPFPLPAWVHELRPFQVDAVREILEAFEEVDVVFLDAPVGAGKTLIGELVRREMKTRGVYICSDKALQDQFMRDFPYAKVMKGRSNYPTLMGRGRITAEDCTAQGRDSRCRYCDPKWECPYRVAKEQALAADIAVLNTSYFLSATNFAGAFGENDLVIADECDMLEGALIGFVEYEVPRWMGEKIDIEYPKKAVRKPTLVRWLTSVELAAREYLAEMGDVIEPKQRRSIDGFASETKRIAQMLQRDIDNAAKHEDDDSDGDESGHWIRDYDTKTFKLRPVTVSQYGMRNLWRHGEKWLLMSGTIVSSDELAASLGVPVDYRTVTVDSAFPADRRPVILAPVANVTRAGGVDEWDKLVYAIEEVLRRHDGRVLVHTVSYALAGYLYDKVEAGRGRRKVTYRGAAGKYDAMREYLRERGAVMFAPSMDRGVDLAGDKCEVQIVAKCPFPSLGDKQVSARLRMPEGQMWYSVKTIRDIVQMTGRGMRSADDSCVTYILDRQFMSNVWGRNKHLFPAYFRDAVDAKADIRGFIKPNRAA